MSATQGKKKSFFTLYKTIKIFFVYTNHNHFDFIQKSKSQIKNKKVKIIIFGH